MSGLFQSVFEFRFQLIHSLLFRTFFLRSISFRCAALKHLIHNLRFLSQGQMEDFPSTIGPKFRKVPARPTESASLDICFIRSSRQIAAGQLREASANEKWILILQPCRTSSSGRAVRATRRAVAVHRQKYARTTGDGPCTRIARAVSRINRNCASAASRSPEPLP